jgi:hypothetical protein
MRHFVGPQRCGPLDQLPAVVIESAKLLLLDAHAAVDFLGRCAGHDLRLMDAEADRKFLQCHQPYIASC